MIGVLLGLYLARLGLDAAAIGLVVGAGLAGGATASLVVTLLGDRLGRRRCLVVLALLAAAGGLVVALTGSPVALGVAAFLGMVNGMGRDRGAALVLEQAVLPATTTDAGRTQVFAWYNVLQDAGHAGGALLASLPAALTRLTALDDLAALQIAIGAYAALMLATAVGYRGLSPAADARVAGPRVRVSPETRRILWRLSSLFALDSLGGGFLTTALLSLFFAERFGVGAGTLGPLFAAARIANAASHAGAAWLAKQIGLVNTMVFTHVPSSLLLVTVAFAPTFPIAAALFLLREGLVEMDVPTRQSYVMAVVQPDERTVASGVTSLVRMGAWAVAPSCAGLLAVAPTSGLPLVAGAALKITYDVLLWRAFRHAHPPEER